MDLKNLGGLNATVAVISGRPAFRDLDGERHRADVGAGMAGVGGGCRRGTVSLPDATLPPPGFGEVVMESPELVAKEVSGGRRDDDRVPQDVRAGVGHGEDVE